MNLRKRLEIRAIINLIISVIERLVSIFDRIQKQVNPETNKPDTPPVKPNKPRPIKRIVNTIHDIIPLPWKKNE